MTPVIAVWLVTFPQTPVVPAPLAEYDRVNLERNLRWILERDRTRPAKPPRVGVFADAGVWHIGAKSIVAALESKGIGCAVLDRSRLTVEHLSKLEALVIPGGWAPFIWTSAGEDGLMAVRQYVERGGRCLGICAGAYLLAKTVRYESTDCPYPLGLFDGIARGPVAGLAVFPTPGSVRLKVTADGRERGLVRLTEADCYFSGGPCFDGGTAVTVLATYPDGSAAVVTRSVGKGRVILCGVHVERPVPPAGELAHPPAEAGELLVKLIGL